MTHSDPSETPRYFIYACPECRQQIKKALDGEWYHVHYEGCQPGKPGRVVDGVKLEVILKRRGGWAK